MSSPPTEFAPLLPEHWPAVAAIYAEGIESGHATFETSVPTWEAWTEAHRASCRLIAVVDGRVIGFAALSPVSKRAVYRGVAEVSIYVAGASRGRGIGRGLLGRLVRASEEEGIWTLQAGIFAANIASIALHEHCGFRLVGTRHRIGQLRGAWHDVVLMERRSNTAGV